MKDAPVLDVDEALRVCVPEVALVREAEVDLGLVERILDLVRVHARREARDDLLALELVRRVQHVVVDQDVVAEEVELGGRDWTGSTGGPGTTYAPCASCWQKARRL